VTRLPGFFAQHTGEIFGLLALVILAVLALLATRRVSKARRDVRGLRVTLKRDGVLLCPELRPSGKWAEVFPFIIRDEDSAYARLETPERGWSVGVYQVRRAGRGMVRLLPPRGLRPYEIEIGGPGLRLDNGLELSFRGYHRSDMVRSGKGPALSSADRTAPLARSQASVPDEDWTGEDEDWTGGLDWPGRGHDNDPAPADPLPPYPPVSVSAPAHKHAEAEATRAYPPLPAGGTASRDTGAHDNLRPGDHEEPRHRFLAVNAPERVPAGARIGIQVQVTLAAARGASAALKGFPVKPAGTVVTITVSAPGLIPLGDLEQDLTVPFAADSDPVRFGFLAGPIGLHSVQVRAFAGGTCLGDLTLEMSVETGVPLEEGRLRTASLPDLAAEPGEVTLQVSRTAAGGYSFQLLSGALYPAVIVDRLARDPGEVIGQMIAELRTMSKSTAQYATPALARRRLRSLGAQLWGDVVPKSVREQFWAQRDRIRLFTIASDMDTVPWELLYPVDPGNDDGFLVEQFPVVRRVYGQERARALRLDRGVGFIIPPRSPADAADEVDAVRAAFSAGVPDRGTKDGLAAVLELLDSVPSVLHFAGHNAFTDETGSLISLDGGPLRPSDLSYARQRRAFEPARPLVFLNGCRTAGEIPGFTQMIGWASEFMGAGAGAFVGSLWPVRSASARTFAAEFYRALVCGGESLGTASLRARQAIAADEGDPTWLAYTVYGNPSASIEGHVDPR
jgi:hypothetical protein